MRLGLLQASRVTFRGRLPPRVHGTGSFSPPPPPPFTLSLSLSLSLARSVSISISLSVCLSLSVSLSFSQPCINVNNALVFTACLPGLLSLHKPQDLNPKPIGLFRKCQKGTLSVELLLLPLLACKVEDENASHPPALPALVTCHGLRPCNI